MELNMPIEPHLVRSVIDLFVDDKLYEFARIPDSDDLITLQLFVDGESVPMYIYLEHNGAWSARASFGPGVDHV